MLTVGSSVRCSTSVGTEIDGRIFSMLIPLFMRIRLMTADGLPPSLSKRPHHRWNSASPFFDGANAAMLLPVPQAVST
jgi:hypothetical protein